MIVRDLSRLVEVEGRLCNLVRPPPWRGNRKSSEVLRVFAFLREFAARPNPLSRKRDRFKVHVMECNRVYLCLDSSRSSRVIPFRLHHRKNRPAPAPQPQHRHQATRDPSVGVRSCLEFEHTG